MTEDERAKNTVITDVHMSVHSSLSAASKKLEIYGSCNTYYAI